MSKLHIFSAAAVAASLWMVGMGQASAAVPQNTEAAPTNEIAQALPTPAGLTVVGVGSATAPADTAVIYLNYYSNYYPQPTESSSAPPLPPTPTAADIKPVVDALVAAGAIANNIETNIDPNAAGSFRVRAKFEKPTQAKIQALVAAANAAASKNGKFSTGGAQIGYFTNNCPALETEARRLAMADARSRSSALATIADVTLGNLVSVMESATFGYYGGGFTACPSATDNQALQDPYAMQGVDLLSPSVVRINSSVSVTYEME